MVIDSVAYLFAMFDQCALDESGGLKEANKIEFFFSKSETMPLPSSTASLQRNPGNAGKSNICYCNVCTYVSQGFDMVNGRRT